MKSRKDGVLVQEAIFLPLSLVYCPLMLLKVLTDPFVKTAGWLLVCYGLDSLCGKVLVVFLWFFLSSAITSRFYAILFRCLKSEIRKT